MKTYVERFRVGFQDTDSTSRIYFPTYVKWFDMAFIEFLRRNGVVFDPQGKLVVDNKPLDRTLVIGEYGCRILKPSKYDDLLDVHTYVSEVREKVVKAEFYITSPPDDVEVSRGWITYVCVDTENGRSAEIPEKLRKVFESIRTQ
ncbi:MAG: acyl-CoA thioesterase [Candidatus Caldarchaeum sp.]|nr:acyl-CoA thioesterase [Candidatus Caldarchaeum sp.]MDW7977719.1 acyl-CoA thioesterase [Candidatus Caldarchaeum sp.]MDW8360543.1 acyl-CoA thioesterase [Candidatus Caldarchaeum sp.]